VPGRDGFEDEREEGEGEQIEQGDDEKGVWIADAIHQGAGERHAYASADVGDGHENGKHGSGNARIGALHGEGKVDRFIKAIADTKDDHGKDGKEGRANDHKEEDGDERDGN